MTAIIQIEKLTKMYGSHRGVIEVDLSLEQGEIFGFLGPNGAGKTTTIRTILDLIRPTSGRALRVRHRHARRPGRDPPAGGLHPGRVHPLRPVHRRADPRVLREPARGRRSRLPATPDRAFRARPIAPLPRVQQGQQAEGRRRHCAPAPTGAARPRRADLGARPARPADVLRRPCARRWPTGPAVFLSSHILSEVEKTRDRVAIIREGRIVKIDTVEGLRDLAHHQVELRFAGPVPAAEFEAPARGQ